jgi:hypothetical protein
VFLLILGELKLIYQVGIGMPFLNSVFGFFVALARDRSDPSFAARGCVTIHSLALFLVSTI